MPHPRRATLSSLRILKRWKFIENTARGLHKCRGVMTDRSRVKATGDEKVLDPRKVLGSFRVDQKKLAKKNKYQVLWFPMGDPLTESDKQARWEVISEHVS
ncbi:hypothetical protein B0F90DRAFT_810240 [Multifurca ochricompacta]|uniref:Uncharacterized protein n=1 Tax=Multifurca ochricompacta TaxID=376703 RepID=A0AAD4QQK7_9AGAM|nr:hypothetical protein B0F90DRAFT_810240 [Multifurca ochricompacta]